MCDESLVYGVGPSAPIGRAHAAVVKKPAGGAPGIGEAGRAAAVQKIGVLQSGNESKTGLHARRFMVSGGEQGTALERWQADLVDARKTLGSL